MKLSWKEKDNKNKEDRVTIKRRNNLSKQFHKRKQTFLQPGSSQRNKNKLKETKRNNKRKIKSEDSNKLRLSQQPTIRKNRNKN